MEIASRKLNSIEINGSFYSLQRPEFFQQWYDSTPDDFVFSVKGGRFITHMKKLRDVDEATANFFASGLLKLKEKLGPILWQFPPNFKFNAERIEAFFKLLPRDTLEAAKLAKKHNDKLKGRAWTRADAKRPIRHAMEVRHDSFKDNPDFIKLLKTYNVAIVVADTAGKWPFIEDVTADFVYIRLHGDEQIYVSGYDDASLGLWAEKICRWRKNGDVYCYFDNDVKVRAPFDAMNLAARINGANGPDNCAVAPPIESISEEPRTSWPVIRRKRAARVTSK